MTRTTVKVAPGASRVLRKSAIVASLCAVMLVAGMLHPTYAYADTLSDAKAALTAAQKELTAAQNALTAAQNTLTAANNAFASVNTSKGKVDTVNSQANSSAGITNDVVFTNQTPLYVPVNGNTGKPSSSTLVGVTGTYVNGTSVNWTQQQVVDYVNNVRWDAKNSGLVDKYVAVAWSKNLERTAQIRAAEASLYGDHTRPSGEQWHGVSNEGLMQGSAENLSWGGNYKVNVEMWVDEKADYAKYLNCSKGKKTVNGVNQCNYGVYGHYRNLVNPQYNKIGIAQFNSDRATVNPYGTAMAAEFSYAANSGSADVKATNTTVNQGVYVKSAAVGSVGTAGATTFNVSKVSGDPVWTHSAKVAEAKGLAKSMASTELSRIQSDYNTKKAAVTKAQNDVTAAQAKVTTAQNKVNAALDKYVAAGGTAAMGGIEIKTSWTRLAGATQFDTMAEIAKAGFTQTGGTVVVATSSGYQDALSASGVAGIHNAPILFTDSKKLTAQTKEQLARLKPKTVIVAGGKYVVGDSVLNEIKNATGVATTVTRYAGAAASDTADELAMAGKGNWSKNAIVVTDASYWDALSVGPYAYAKHAPIFYAQNGKKLSANTLNTMKSLGITKVYIIGGKYAVDSNVDTQIKDKGIGVERIYGQTMINTSQAVAQFAIKEGMSVNKMGIATTNGYYDGLAASPLLGKNNSVLVLTDSKDLSAINNIYVNGKKTTFVSQAYIFGGKYAVSESVYNHVNK